MANLALFDFDGTITHTDTFTPFIHYAVHPFRIALGRIVFVPIVIAYKLKVAPATRVRRLIVRFGFSWADEVKVREQGAAYSRKFLPSFVRPKALERINWHKAQGDTVVVVSASLDVYLSDWCKSHGLDLLCAELEALNGRMTGRYRGRDCTGLEKARRVQARYDLSMFETIYAYGDTPEDHELLNLAHKKIYCWREWPNSSR